MATIKENAVWESEIYRLTTEAEVLGFNAEDNSDGPSNVQAQQLANRTAFLKKMLDVVQIGENPFQSVAAAQQAINEGRIPNGAKFSVIAVESEQWVSEYQNISGVATLTGRNLLSEMGVRGLIDSVISLVQTTQANIDYLLNAFVTRDAIPGYSFALVGRNGVPIGFLSDGSVRAASLSLPSFEENSREGPLGIPIIQERIDGIPGTVGAMFYPKTGKVGLLLDEQSIDHIRQELGEISGGYVPPSVIRGGWQVANVRVTNSFNFATVQERRNALIFDSKQKASGTVTTLIPDNPLPMRVRGVMGQSNSVFAGNTPVNESRQLFPFSAFTFDYGSLAQGGSGNIDETQLTEFVPLADKPSQTSNQLPATLTSFANEYLKRTMGGVPLGEVVFTAGEGSVALEMLLPGSVNWNNYVKFLRKAVEIATSYNRKVSQRFVTLIQGETGNDWARDYPLWASAIIAKIKEIAPDTEKTHILLWQITGGGLGYENGVGPLQIAAADSREDTILIGSMSGFPTVSDNTHLTAEGRMMLAECQAYVERIIEAHDNGDGPEWQPLRIKKATRVGDTITLEMSLPPWTTLARDTDWTPDIAEDGYVYANDKDGVISISRFDYHRNSIEAKLSRAPSSDATNERISYGLNTRSETGIGWPWYRGKTIGITSQRSLYNSLGHNVPEFIRFYLLRERIGVSK